MVHIEKIGNAEFVRNILRKMAPPLGKNQMVVGSPDRD